MMKSSIAESIFQLTNCKKIVFLNDKINNIISRNTLNTESGFEIMKTNSGYYIDCVLINLLGIILCQSINLFILYYD